MLRLLGMSAAAFLMASTAHATIIIAEGAIGTGDNVLFNNNPADGVSISGVLNSSPNFFVNFTSTESLHGNGGQARLEGTDGSLNYVSMTLPNPLLFSTAVFNLNITRALPGDVVTLTAYDQFGATFSYVDSTLSFGQNFYNFTTSGGELISRIDVSTSNNFLDLRQIRIGGVASAVPEPSTWAMMLLGFAGLGYLAHKRRRTAVAV